MFLLKYLHSRLVYSQTKPFVLVFDDLTMDNYKVHDDPLAFEQLKPIISRIGKFHALSLVLLQNGHADIAKYEGAYSSAMEALFVPMSVHLQNAAEIVKSWSGFEEMGQKLYDNGSKIPGKFLKLSKTKTPDRFFVLNHGDFHVRNLMFQENVPGEFSDVIFLDFQMPVYFSPGFDLVGLINTMGDMDVRRRSMEVIKEYHGQLVASLRKYGFTGDFPTAIDIHIEMMRNAAYNCFSTLLAMPMFRIKGMELGEIFNTAPDSPCVVGIKDAYNDPHFVEHIKPLIKYFYDLGVFDE